MAVGVSMACCFFAGMAAQSNDYLGLGAFMLFSFLLLAMGLWEE